MPEVKVNIFADYQRLASEWARSKIWQPAVVNSECGTKVGGDGQKELGTLF